MYRRVHPWDDGRVGGLRATSQRPPLPNPSDPIEERRGHIEEEAQRDEIQAFHEGVGEYPRVHKGK